VILLVEKTNWC